MRASGSVGVSSERSFLGAVADGLPLPLSSLSRADGAGFAASVHSYLDAGAVLGVGGGPLVRCTGPHDPVLELVDAPPDSDCLPWDTCVTPVRYCARLRNLRRSPSCSLQRSVCNNNTRGGSPRALSLCCVFISRPSPHPPFLFIPHSFSLVGPTRFTETNIACVYMWTIALLGFEDE